MTYTLEWVEVFLYSNISEYIHATNTGAIPSKKETWNRTKLKNTTMDNIQILLPDRHTYQTQQDAYEKPIDFNSIIIWQ